MLHLSERMKFLYLVVVVQVDIGKVQPLSRWKILEQYSDKEMAYKVNHML